MNCVQRLIFARILSYFSMEVVNPYFFDRCTQQEKIKCLGDPSFTLHSLPFPFLSVTSSAVVPLLTEVSPCEVESIGTPCGLHELLEYVKGERKNMNI